MAALDAESDRLVRLAWAPRTLQMYEVGMENFKKFRHKLGDTDITAPSNPLQINRFIAYLSLEGKAPSTISAYISAISNWHKTNRFVDPTNDFLVKKALKGGSRGPRDQDLREPITLELLSKLVSALQPVCESVYEQKMMKCAYLLAFFGLFRIGEFIADTKTRAQKSVILISDIAIKPGFLKITVRFSKTDQSGKAHSLIFEGQKENPLCPVRATLEFLKLRGTNPGPLLMHYNGTFLSRFQFNKVLAAALKLADPSKTNVKAHSFRIGGATNAMFKGIPYEQIKSMGRWKSDAAKLYIRQTDINIALLN